MKLVLLGGGVGKVQKLYFEGGPEWEESDKKNIFFAIVNDSPAGEGGGVNQQMSLFFFVHPFFIGPRYTWGPIYGSKSLSLSH